MAEMVAARTAGGIQIEQHCTLLIAGDQHLVGRVPPFWNWKPKPLCALC